MTNKFKVGDYVIVNTKPYYQESVYNGTRAKIIDMHTTFAGLKQNVVVGTWYVPLDWLTHSNSQIIRERLGIK